MTKELDELKQAIIDALSGPQKRRGGQPRQQWEIDMEQERERRERLYLYGVHSSLDRELEEKLRFEAQVKAEQARIRADRRKPYKRFGKRG
jgi:hypothetical protein